jgi:ubiquinone/menaquinone biosynthesis C-methylase UbiE
VARLAKFVDLRGKTLLDVGCGIGDMPAEAAELGANAIGLDLAGDWIKAGSRDTRPSLPIPPLLVADGEALPFTAESFDIVTSNFALEHTPRPGEMIREMARVLKPEGLCYVNAPNYLFPWEQHYGVLWVPFLPKALARPYLRVLGRRPAYVDDIHYVTRSSVRRHLNAAGLTERVDLVREMIADPSLAASGSARSLLRAMNRLSAFGSLLLEVFPIVSIIAQKPRPQGRGSQ